MNIGLARSIAGAILALGAAIPGAASAAGSKVTPETQSQHLQTLFSPEVEGCMDMDGTPAQDRVAMCQDAIAQVEGARTEATDIGTAGQANFDFMESMLQVLLGQAFADIDKKPTARACSALERSWALRYRLLSLPQDSVSETAYGAYRNLPKSVDFVISTCRKEHGKPKDGAPLPSEIKL